MTAVTGAARLALVPLDERPVNTRLVADVARIGGAELLVLPEAVGPHFRSPGDPEAIGAWVEDVAGEVDAVVLSVDTLVHGGLIPARISHDPLDRVLARLDRLAEVARRHPALRISAVSLVTRASDSYSAVEEPEYWSRYGRDLHAWGAAAHRRAEHQETSAAMPPADVRIDFARRRLRNHVVNLRALDLAWEGVIDHLAITADDTATYSAGSAEQRALDYWRALQPEPPVLCYPGADEVGAVLVARELVRRLDGPPRVAVVPGDDAGMSLVPNFENVPLTVSVGRQLAAAGAEQVRDPDEADLVVVVHTPDPAGADQFSLDRPVSDPAAVTATVAAVKAALTRRAPVALADLRYSNGSDPALVEALAGSGDLWRLASYAGWNTAGNALGSAIALGLAVVAGARAGTLDRRWQRVALRRRVLDDHCYQSVLRARHMPGVFGMEISPRPATVVLEAERLLTEDLGRELRRLDPTGDHVLRAVRLPWARSFEVDLDVAAGR